MYRSTKAFHNYPCSHRQWRDEGHCAHIHGYSRSFHFVFGAHDVDACGWVVDFGGMRWLKDVLDHTFDHTLLLACDDPLLPHFKQLEAFGACALRLLPYGPGMEGTARWLCEIVDERIRRESRGRCWVISCESRENDKNSGIWVNPKEVPIWLKGELT